MSTNPLFGFANKMDQSGDAMRELYTGAFQPPRDSLLK